MILHVVFVVFLARLCKLYGKVCLVYYNNRVLYSVTYKVHSVLQPGGSPLYGAHCVFK